MTCDVISLIGQYNYNSCTFFLKQFINHIQNNYDEVPSWVNQIDYTYGVLPNNKRYFDEEEFASLTCFYSDFIFSTSNDNKFELNEILIKILDLNTPFNVCEHTLNDKRKLFFYVKDFQDEDLIKFRLMYNIHNPDFSDKLDCLRQLNTIYKG